MSEVLFSSILGCLWTPGCYRDGGVRRRVGGRQREPLQHDVVGRGLGGEHHAEGEHQDGDEARVFWIRTGEVKQGSRAGVHRGVGRGERVYASDDRGPLWRIGRSRSLEGRTCQRQPTTYRLNISTSIYPSGSILLSISLTCLL
jgi:hypothetical protein